MRPCLPWVMSARRGAGWECCGDSASELDHLAALGTYFHQLAGERQRFARGPKGPFPYSRDGKPLEHLGRAARHRPCPRC